MINDTSLSCCKVVGYDWGQMVVVFMAQLVLVSLDWMHLVFFFTCQRWGFLVNWSLPMDIAKLSPWL